MADLAELDIEYWDAEDGWVGAHMAKAKDVTIWAADEQKLFEFFIWLMSELDKREKQRKAHGHRGALFPGMEATTIDGKLHIRFHKFPGVGLECKRAYTSLKEWYALLVKAAIKANRTKRAQLN